MKKYLLLVAITSLGLIACSGKKDDEPQPYIGGPIKPVDKGWAFETTAFWTDEFNYNGALLTDKWDYDTGGGGWGNNELQNYTNTTNNASVANGKLTITARKENSGGRNYSSARVVTRKKFDFLYGRIEVKAKIPGGRGTWPAIWLLPTDYEYGAWPNSGEFDMMEHVGYDPNVVHVSAHTGAYNFKLGNQKSGIKTIPNVTADYHTYRVDWTPYAVRGYVDDVLYLEYVNDGTGSASWPFDKKFHLLMNVAVGGDWGGQKGVDDSIFPVAMEVEYVRYFKMIEK